YDRAHSAFSTIGEETVDWEAVFEDATWFHWTGITPAIGEGPAQVCLGGIRKAKEKGITVSCDLNYRKKLWKWGKAAGEVMAEMVALCDYAVGNEEDAEKVFGIKAPGGDWEKGKVDKEHYRAVAETLIERFPSLKGVAITLRGSLSASHNTWSGIFYTGGTLYAAPVYDILPIVDRVGGGDAFAGGLIYGLLTYPDDPQRIIDFAVAASCLKHTIPGDFNLASVAEVEKLRLGNASGRVER
ncbi:MAG: sugar kinase, partial [Deltaproteobacteria bacterium]|nr:sugar kinase [Deltaproteobacteria bacterium]